MTRPDRSEFDRRQSERGGRRAETLAALWLRLKFYRVLAQRVRSHAGEIDLVALSPSGILCFVEVKTRKDEADAIESVSFRQRARIERAAEYYLGTHPRLRPRGVRFDVVAIVPKSLPKHLKDAWRPEA